MCTVLLLRAAPRLNRTPPPYLHAGKKNVYGDIPGRPCDVVVAAGRLTVRDVTGSRKGHATSLVETSPHPNAVDATLMAVIIACFHRELTGVQSAAS